MYIGQRKRRTKGERGCGWWKRLHHQLAPILIALSVCSHTCAHVPTPQFLSDTLSSLPYHLISLPQMKKIGGVMFKCGNAFSGSATSINTAAFVPSACTHMQAYTCTYTQSINMFAKKV